MMYALTAYFSHLCKLSFRRFSLPNTKFSSATICKAALQAVSTPWPGIVRRFAYLLLLLWGTSLWAQLAADARMAEPSAPPATLSYFSQAVYAQEPGITSPAAGSSVSGNVPIMGTAVIEPFQRYEIYIKQEPNGDDAYIYVSGGTQPVVNGQLGTLNIDTFAPGTYSIRLRVVKLDGNYAEYFAPNINFNQEPTEPTPTATSSEPTPTPIPTATFTPAPQPTPIVGQVTQPEIQDGGAANTPTSEPVAETDDAAISDTGSTVEEAEAGDTDETLDTQNLSLPGGEPEADDTANESGITSQLGEAVGLDRLRNHFMTGMRYSAYAFILIGILFLAKGVLRWMLTQFES